MTGAVRGSRLSWRSTVVAPLTDGRGDLAPQRRRERPLEAGEHLGEVVRQRVVLLVGQREQPQLAPQLAVVPSHVGDLPQREAVDADRGAVPVGVDLVGDRAGDRVVVGVEHLRLRVVALVRRPGGLEPHALAVVLDRGTPRDGAHRHDAQAPPEGRQQVVELLILVLGDHGGMPRPVGDLDPGMLHGATDPHGDGVLGVQERVGDELGDPQLRALHEVVAAELVAGRHHPPTGLLDGARVGVECQGWLVQRHDDPKGGGRTDRPLATRVPHGLRCQTTGPQLFSRHSPRLLVRL